MINRTSISVIRVTAVLTLCLLFTTEVRSQPLSARISGSIVHPTENEVVPGANIRLVQGGKEVAGVAADVSGRFTFSDLEAGDYALRVDFVGFTSVQRDITLREGEDVDLSLRIGFRVTEVDYEQGRLEALEDLERGVISLRSLADRPIIRTGGYACSEVQEAIRKEIAERDYGLTYVEVYADYDALPEEVLQARVVGYNCEVDRRLQQRLGSDWRQNLRAEARRETRVRQPECFD
jgi:hypothetical protein